MRLPLDYARVNEIPAWYVVDPASRYGVTLDGRKYVQTGQELIDGLDVTATGGKPVRIRVVDFGRSPA